MIDVVAYSQYEISTTSSLIRLAMAGATRDSDHGATEKCKRQLLDCQEPGSSHRGVQRMSPLAHHLKSKPDEA